LGVGDTTRRVLVRFVTEDVNSASVASNMRSQFAAVAAVAGVAAAGIAAVGAETARLDDIAKGAQKSGLGFEAYQQLDRVAKLAGTDVGKLAKATVTLEKNLLTVARGSGKEAADALADLGLKQEALAGKTTTERLGVLSGALSEIEDETTRAALASQLMGKSGRDLLPLFNQGAEVIDELVASTGHMFTREDLAKAEAYQDALTELDKVAKDTTGTLVLAAAPALTKVAGKLTEAGKEAGAVLPAITRWLENVADGLGPPIKLVGFFAEQLAAFGRVADFVGGKVDRATEAVSDFAGGVVDAIAESDVADWAREATAGITDFDTGLGGLSETVQEQIPFTRDLALQWDEFTRAITGAEGAVSEFSGIKDIQKGIGDLLKLGAGLVADAEKRADAQLLTVDGVQSEATETERLAELMRASGDTRENVNALLRDALVLRRDAAVLAKDELKTAEATHKLAVFDAEIATEAAKPKGGGGRGPSRADRVRSAGAGAVQELEHMADLQKTIAGTADEIFEAEEAARAARLAALDLEREALAVTTARRGVAREELETAREAVDQEAGLIVLEGREAARKRELEATKDLQAIEIARNAARAEEEGRVISLETFRLDSLAKQLEAQGQLSAAAGVRQQQRQQEADFAAQEFAAREEELALRPPEGELEEIERKDALAQLAHDREMARIQEDGAARQAHDAEIARLGKVEAKRKKDSIAQTKAIAGASRQILSQGQAFAGRVLDAAGVDGEKRQRIDMKIAGISALATGALETVKAVAAGASLNPVQAAAHAAAAAFAIGTGISLLAGNVPSGSGASAAAPGPEPRQERETGEAPTIPGSVPAADREPSQRFGADPRAGVGNVFNGDITINATGSIDDDTLETISTGLGNLEFKRGA
jgi:hypothetical protein